MPIPSVRPNRSISVAKSATTSTTAKFLGVGRLLTLLAIVALSGGAIPDDKFRQLEEILPTPTTYRTASGAPGVSYWQQRADYVIQAELNDDKQSIQASAQINYHNNSPDQLTYLWLQLDQNIFKTDSDGALSQTAPGFKKFPYRSMAQLLARRVFDGGYRIQSVVSKNGDDLKFTIVKTMMRIDMPKPLEPGESFAFSIEWFYPINDAKTIRARSGYEYFEEDGNYIYEIAQWFPRMVAYTDVNGWQHKQFIGSGEFTLELGNYEVSLTVPEDFIVGATGVLQNPEEVLSSEQQQRLEAAESSGKPIFIVTPDEAKENERKGTRNKNTWVYRAENVRDFAFAASRKFIWDAMQHDSDGNSVMAMSLYPNEAEPLWSTYSTQSIVHTLNVYSSFTFAYPYPVAYSINGPIGGMEYPMICFNGPRTEDDGTYFGKAPRSFWNRSKYALISVIIHEVGHNYFPMIVNTDERQWTWMDEGLNSFLQYLAEQAWEDEYPSRRGEPQNIVNYMKSNNQVPIMTNSESLLQFGNNAYGKPATALNILRETILGRELFDFAFKEYARRWQFKRPMPADFFRTMEDASGIDLDWFWRGWFYGTDHVDIAVENLHLYELDTMNPKIEKPRERQKLKEAPVTVSGSRFQDEPKLVDQIPELKDFYNTYDSLEVTTADIEKFEELLEDLEKDEKQLLKTDLKFYVVDFSNVGGLVMPIILDIEYGNGKLETVRIPATIWRRNSKHVSKLFLTDQEIKSITVDPHLETADTNVDNNHWPRKVIPSRFKLFKDKKPKNPMQKAQENQES